MTTIAVDIDNTAYSFEQAARQAYIELAEERDDTSLFKGAYNPWGEWRTMSDCCGEEACFAVIDKVHSPHVIAAQEPYPDVVEVLWELAHEGYDLHYISNRSPDAFEATMAWLYDNNFPEGQITCNLNDKVAQVSECQYIIDDRPKTLVQFVYERDWQSPARPQRHVLTDVPGISLAPTWSGLRHYLKKKGVLSGQRSQCA